MKRFSILPLTLLAGLASAQTNWSLSGKIVDAEEGNGLNAVDVSLAKAGLRTTTAKNGTWILSSNSGVGHRPSGTSRSENFLHLEGGRLTLRLDGTDLLGRRMIASIAPPAAISARSMDAVSDTLIYTRDGFMQKRVPLSSSVIVSMVDSLRRIRYDGWVDSSHSNGFKPDTADAFPDTVRTFTFRITKARWDSLMKAMADSCGKFGSGQLNCGNGLDMVESSATIWVPADLHADGQVWKNIAFRLKGNASLRTAWTKGSYVLPFRINMDKFEDAYPQTKNQRFHGFKKLSFYTPDQDSSSVRSPIASEIFREAGAGCPITTPAHVLLDRGDGNVSDLGLYELVEVPDNPMLNRLYGNDTGHLYKPESNLSRFTRSEWEDEDIETDYADAKALIDAINASNRTTDTAAWHRTLEKVIDVDGFLNWLAVNTAIYNWDTYGALGHNYYLYNDQGRFRWIAYDISFSFNLAQNQMSRTSIWYDGSGGFGGFGGGFPLIKNLLADKSYCELYRSRMTQAIAPTGPAGVANFQAKVDKYATMVAAFPQQAQQTKAIRDVMTIRKSEIEASLAAKACPIK
ncbi:MAG TPA: CotH kinase family protein [Fibrobacteria bacterium]|nr:CotH kinase family protein [Fibrobacteria bacterium]HOX50001.1 CotH kinase family protein [Fibrobacteria bacterium]